MSDDLSARRLNVSARDQHGALLHGAKITFEIGGSVIGVVEDSDGHGDVIRPSGDQRPTTVTVSHAGKTQSASVAYGQSQHTFVFQTSDPQNGPVSRPADPRRPVLMLAGLGAAALVAVALVVLPRFEPRGDPADAAAEGIAKRCAGGRTISNESDITAGLSEAITELGAGAKVTSSDVGAVTANLTPTEGGIAFYKIYTACLKQETESYLQLRGVQVVSAPARAQPVAPSAPTPVGRITGWSYYEERRGQPTADGVLVPPGSVTVAPYAAVKVGQILKSRSGFKIRTEPRSVAEIVQQVPAASCVQVLSPPGHKVKVSEATSGGYLQVARVACPSP